MISAIAKAQDLSAFHAPTARVRRAQLLGKRVALLCLLSSRGPGPASPLAARCLRRPAHRRWTRPGCAGAAMLRRTSFATPADASNLPPRCDLLAALPSSGRREALASQRVGIAHPIQTKANGINVAAVDPTIVVHPESGHYPREHQWGAR
jgi:hypothetical protein